MFTESKVLQEFSIPENICRNIISFPALKTCILAIVPWMFDACSILADFESHRFALLYFPHGLMSMNSAIWGTIGRPCTVAVVSVLIVIFNH